MQIGTPGAAYGPGGVMSRPTLGRQIVPMPTQQNAISSALSQARRMPGPMGRTDVIGMFRGLGSGGRTQHAVLGNENTRRAALLAQLRQGGVLRRPQPLMPATYVPEAPAGPYVGTLPEGYELGANPAPVAPDVSTIDPAILLARARLSALMGGGS